MCQRVQTRWHLFNSFRFNSLPEKLYTRGCFSKAFKPSSDLIPISFVSLKNHFYLAILATHLSILADS